MDAILKDFILAHADDDCGRLLLGRDRWRDIDMRTAVNIIESRRKLKSKLPQWYASEGLIYPNTLSAEQCSGEAASRYKVDIICNDGSNNGAEKFGSRSGQQNEGSHDAAENCGAGNGHRDTAGRLEGMAIADLTGGLGVDSATFAAAGAKVLYNEMDRDIYDAAVHNFPLLGVDVTCRNMELRAENVDEILGNFQPDIVFLDPARRSGSGGKVFRLEDCSPDLTQLLRPLFQAAPRIIVKLSPMADITLVCRQLEAAAGFHCVHSVHVVGSQGECKELVLDLHRNLQLELEPLITVAVDGRYGRTCFCFRQSEEKTASITLCGSPSELEKAHLFEPCSALMKAAPFRLLCSFGMKKAGFSTQLYFIENKEDTRENQSTRLESEVEAEAQKRFLTTTQGGVTAKPSGELTKMGRTYEVIEILPLDKRGIKAVSRKYPEAEVSARNMAMNSDTLRKKLGVRSSDSIHIFGIRCDFLNAPTANYLLVTRRLK